MTQDLASPNHFQNPGFECFTQRLLLYSIDDDHEYKPYAEYAGKSQLLCIFLNKLMYHLNILRKYRTKHF